jgi:hypothetical protein
MSPYNSDGIAIVIKDDKGGLIRRDGTFVVPPKFARFRGVAEGVVAAGEHEDGPEGLLDYSGKWIKTPQFDWIDAYSGGLAEARKDGRSGYIDTCGNWRIPPQYSVDGPTWPFSKNGTIVRTMDGGKLLVGRDGNEKPLPEGWGIDFFRWETDLVVVVDRDAKRGLMDSSGKIVVAPKYAWLEPVGGGVYIAHRVGNIGDDNRLILDVRCGEIEIDPPPAVPGWSD